MPRRAWVVLFCLLPAAPVWPGEGEVRLLTDDAIPRYLERGQMLAKAEQWAKMVDVLQRVVEGDKDVFPDLSHEVLHSAVYSADGSIFYPARELCLQQLAKLPPEGLQAYRASYDGKARALLEQAEAETDLRERSAGYSLVYDLYFVSSIADDALEQAGDLNLSLGRFYEALGQYRRLLLVYPKDTDRDLASVCVKAAFCAAHIGDAEVRREMIEYAGANFGDRTVRIEGKAVPTTSLAEHPQLRLRAATEAGAARDWPMAGGSPSRARTTPDLAPDLPQRPFWSFHLHERDPRLMASVGYWFVSQHDRMPLDPAIKPQAAHETRAPYPTVRPVLGDGIVYYKDYNEINGRSLGSGHPVVLRGRYYDIDDEDDPAAYYPVQEVRPGAQQGRKAATQFERAYRFFDYGGNALTLSRGLMFAVENKRPPSHLITEDQRSPRPPNLFVAYDRASGKTAWMWDAEIASAAVRADPGAEEAWNTDFQNHAEPHFYGPGVAANGLAYTLAIEEEEGKIGSVALWAFDAANGRVRFRTTLHYKDETRHRLPVGATLAIAGGVVYVTPGSGIVAAVDALPPGRIRWIRRYDRNYAGGGGRRGGSVQQRFAYNEPVVASGRVIVAPADSKHLLALDADSGRIAWSLKADALGKAWHIVGVGKGVLVVAGREVVGIEIATGEKKWTHSLPGVPYGRGFVGESRVYVPTTFPGESKSGIASFDIESGTPGNMARFAVPRLGNLMFADGVLVAANDEEVMGFTTGAREQARIDAHIARDGESARLRFERGLAALAMEPVRRDPARAEFKRALELLAREPRATQEDFNPIANMALANLFAIAIERRDLSALDEAGVIASAFPAPDDGPHPYEAQIALHRVEVLGHTGRGEEALDALEQYLERYAQTDVRLDRRVVKSGVAAARVRDELLNQNESFRQAFTASVRARIQAAYEKKDKDALEAIPARYGKQSPSEESYFVLAKLCEESEAPAEAEIVLRRFTDDFRMHPRRAEAHLRIALLLARQGAPGAARELREGLSRLDEGGRREHAELIDGINRLLPAEEPPTPPVRIRIPLAAEAVQQPGAAPVPIEGTLPADLANVALLHDDQGYLTLDGAGQVLWRVRNPAGPAAAPGPAEEPATLTAAAAIAAARYARVVGEDLILGDVGGLLRVNATSGAVVWQRPDNVARAATLAQESIEALRKDIQLLGRDGQLTRRSPLPTYVRAGALIVRIHPTSGVEAYDVNTGSLVWVDAQKGMPVGKPNLLGQLLAVGWSEPALVKVYDVADGTVISSYKEAEHTLVAPPVLDPLGRLALITTPDPQDGRGRLHVLNARSLWPAFAAPGDAGALDTFSANAVVLHADGRHLVFHNGASTVAGGSGLKNLHFLDLRDGSMHSTVAADIFRELRVLRTPRHLYVFSHTLGREEQGARLFRIDLQARESIEYDYRMTASAYARPVLTRRYIAVAGSGPRSAHVRLFDRDASVDSAGAQDVFAVPAGRETRELDFQTSGQTRFRTAPAVAGYGEGLAVSNPFGLWSLRARE